LSIMRVSNESSATRTVGYNIADTASYIRLVVAFACHHKFSKGKPAWRE
jgi:hypothetical protein